MNLRSVLSACAIALCLPAHADQLIMKNGDHLSGSVEHVRDGKVAFSTPYAGTIEVDVDAVQTLETDEPLFVKRDDSEVLSGQLVAREGQWAVVNDSGETSLPEAIAAAREAAALTPPKPKVWTGSAEAGGSWRSGENDVLDATLKVTAGREFGKDKLSLSGSAGYGEVEGDVNTRRIKGETRYQHYPNHRLYVYALAGLEHDEPQKLDLRATGGVGVGYDFVKRDRLKLSGDVGLDYTYERWLRYTDEELDNLQAQRRQAALGEIQGVLDGLQVGTLTGQQLYTAAQAARLVLDEVDNTRLDRSASLRLGLTYEKKMFEKAVLTHSLTAWPTIGEWDDYRVLSEAAVSTPLSAALDLRLSLKNEYESVPADRVDKWDHLFQAGIVYRF